MNTGISTLVTQMNHNRLNSSDSSAQYEVLDLMGRVTEIIEGTSSLTLDDKAVLSWYYSEHEREAQSLLHQAPETRIASFRLTLKRLQV